MLRIVFVRMEAFSLVLLSKNALSQSKPWVALEIISVFDVYNAKCVLHMGENKKSFN